MYPFTALFARKITNNNNNKQSINNREEREKKKTVTLIDRIEAHFANVFIGISTTKIVNKIEYQVHVRKVTTQHQQKKQRAKKERRKKRSVTKQNRRDAAVLFEKRPPNAHGMRNFTFFLVTDKPLLIGDHFAITETELTVAHQFFKRKT